MQKLIFRNADGIELNLTEGDFGITEWEGFSADDLNIQSQQVPFQDGGVFLDALLGERELAIIVAMDDGNNLEKRYRLRRQMISTLNPKLGEGVLIYTNDFLSKQIHVIPQLPVFENHNSNDSGTPKVSCTFTACNPYWEDLEETEVTLQNGEYLNIENNGDVNIQLRAEISGNTQKPMLLNTTTRKHIQLEKNYNNLITINTEFGKKSIEENVMNFNLIQGGTIHGLTTDGSNIIYVGEQVFYETKDGEKVSFNIEGLNNAWSEDVCYANGTYVIVGYHPYIYTSTDLKNWTPRVVTGNPTLYRVVYGEGKFVAVGGTTIAYSTDGTSWTTVSSPISNLRYLVYAKNLHLFIASSLYGYQYLTSPDGITWTTRTVTDISTTEDIEEICYSGSKFYFISDEKIPYYSSDGITWTKGTAQSGDLPTRSICYGNNMFISYDQSNNYCGISYDGITWQVIPKPSGGSYRITYINNTFYLCKSQGVVDTSPDGINWHTLYGNVAPRGYFLVYRNNKFITLGTGAEDGVAKTYAYTSEDGYTWEKTLQSIPTDFVIYGVAESQDLIVAVGTSGGIYTSPDGVYWTKQTSGVSNNLRSVAYGNGIFIVVGDSGIILTSADGITWTPQGSYTVALRGICFDNDRNTFLAVGASSTAIKSSDGITWTSVTVTASSYTFTDVKYGNGMYLLVTGNRTYTSKDSEVWVYQGTALSSTKLYYDDNNKTFLMLETNRIHKTYDGINYSSYYLGCHARPTGAVYGNGKYLLLEPTTPYLSESTTKGVKNIISDLEQTSDMNLQIKVGTNQFVFNGGGVSSITLHYRQKYVGV